MVRRDTRAVGASAERAACRFLLARGLRRVAANYRCRHGEIDLVMLDGDCLVFVEVRYRNASRITDAALTVDTRKQIRIAKTAAMFLATRRAFRDHVTRFDVVGIDTDAAGRQSVAWLRDAFRP